MNLRSLSLIRYSKKDVEMTDLNPVEVIAVCVPAHPRIVGKYNLMAAMKNPVFRRGLSQASLIAGSSSYEATVNALVTSFLASKRSLFPNIEIHLFDCYETSGKIFGISEDALPSSEALADYILKVAEESRISFVPKDILHLEQVKLIARQSITTTSTSRSTLYPAPPERTPLLNETEREEEAKTSTFPCCRVS